MKSETLCIAYGSNLNLPHMASRCPTAKVIGISEIKDYELLFRGGRERSVATVEPLEGASVPVLVWKLKERDLQALDRYEGYPHLYRKEILDVELKGKALPALVYIMNEGHPYGSPSEYYLNAIMEGYRTAGFDTDLLECAVERSIQRATEQQETKPEQSAMNSLKWW